MFWACGADVPSLLDVDVKRQRWLEKVAGACERALARDTGAPPDAQHAALLEDIAELLARVRSELDAGAG
jgi:hypothetical protein